MNAIHAKRSILFVALLALAGVAVATGPGPRSGPGQSHTSRTFKGVKANTGTVTHSLKGSRHQLTLSEDFKVPEAPAPHWQIVDSSGQVYLLQRLLVKGDHGDRLNRTITIPAYVPDVARVQIWCAFAETLLGETSFETTIPLMVGSEGGETMMQSTSTFSGVKVNGGTASFTRSGGLRTLVLSEDFKVPDAPAPHWQLVDSRGNVYLLQRLVIKGDTMNRMITVPAYVHDVAKVQIWCAWAEALLGEANFASPVH